MAIKYREAVDLRMSTKQELTSSSENWLKFLRTASNTYKYNFSDQLLIFAQFPNAKAVAVFDVWSKTFGRKIREGEKENIRESNMFSMFLKVLLRNLKNSSRIYGSLQKKIIRKLLFFFLLIKTSLLKMPYQIQ